MPLAPFIQVPSRGKDGSVILGPDGRPVMGVAVNPVKLFVRGYWLIDPQNPAVTLLAGAQTELRYLIDSQGHFDWATLIGNSTGPYTLEFFDAGTNRRLQNRPVHSTTVVGSGMRPFRLPEPYFFNVGDSQRELVCTIRNNIFGQTNTIRLVPYGRRFYHKEAPPDVAREISRRFSEGQRTYSYFLTPRETNSDGTVTAVAGNGTATFTFDMDANADTDLQKFMAVSTGAFTYQLRERATNRTLSNGVIRNTEGWGNAEFPFLVSDTYLLERDKQLLCEVTDISGNSNSIFLTIAGRRLQYV